MKRHAFLLQLVEALLNDASKLQPTIVSTAKDIQTVRSRLEHEGLSFLTITLPNFCTDFFTALEQGHVTSTLFIGWKKRACLPAFLQGFTKLVFDTKTGELKNDASIQAIAAIRQISTFFKKVKMPCTDARTAKALAKYVATDETLDSVFCRLDNSDLQIFTEIADLLVKSLFRDFDPRSILVHHGPGSTADRRTGNKKFIAKGLHVFRPLTTYFPVGDGLIYPNEFSYYLDEDDVSYSDSKLSVQVTTVPKTLKTPRVIAMEPTTMLLVQQGIKDYIVERLEQHPLVRGHINFSDQTVNQRLARSSSLTRQYATLDLSEASDRVHNELVKLMFDSNPLLSACLQLCRSEQACVSEDAVIELNKFASMGSALCFPVEALFFMTVLLVARYKSLCSKKKHTRSPVTLGLIKALIRDIFVYGDDLIVPTDEVDLVIKTLAQYGNVVGLNKSYFRSYFRESCGTDAYKGVEITPVYLRELPRHDKMVPNAIVSTISTSNQLYEHGYWETAQLLRSFVESKVGVLPTFSGPFHVGLGWTFGTNRAPVRFSSSRAKRREEPELQCLEVRTLVPVPVKDNDRINGYSALSKCLRSMEIRSRKQVSLPYKRTISSSDDHLDQTEVRYALKLKRRWVPFTANG